MGVPPPELVLVNATTEAPRRAGDDYVKLFRRRHLSCRSLQRIANFQSWLRNTSQNKAGHADHIPDGVNFDSEKAVAAKVGPGTQRELLGLLIETSSTG